MAKLVVANRFISYICSPLSKKCNDVAENVGYGKNKLGWVGHHGVSYLRHPLRHIAAAVYQFSFAGHQYYSQHHCTFFDKGEQM